tara:strand:- start:744 stop:1187 length:444 start_codon:yes stop_codon:yes gene_type:complete
MSEINLKSFAKISESNEVLQVLTVNASDAATEEAGKIYLQANNNWPAHLWIECANKSESSRGVAGPGYSWDAINEKFFSPQPHASWTKDTTNGTWVCPLLKPDLTADQQSQNNSGANSWEYNWDESAYQADNTTGWVLTDFLVFVPV